MQIAGIQQIGIGIPHVHEAWAWYRKAFGMDIAIFEEAAEANLMLPYTGGVPHKRHAILAMNIQGGGGFEIWQYTSRVPQAATFQLQLGDLGINICKIKCRNIKAHYKYCISNHITVLSEPTMSPSNTLTFFVQDPYGNLFQMVEDHYIFSKTNCNTGGVHGAIMGVSNIDQSLKLYKDILGYDIVQYRSSGVFDDFKPINGGQNEFERILLKHSKPRSGAFSKLLGPTEIELVVLKNKTPNKIFENRYWGDLGFIHLCFDIWGMAELKEKCKNLGFPFTVDSSESFDMGEAAGHFTYIEDPDGALIEFVETHKVPIMKKIGWYINLKKRDATKALPNWMLKSLKFNRKK